MKNILPIILLFVSFQTLAQDSFSQWYEKSIKLSSRGGLEFNYQYDYYESIQSNSPIKTILGKTIISTSFFYNKLDFIETLVNTDFVLITDNEHELLMLDSNKHSRRVGFSIPGVDSNSFNNISISIIQQSISKITFHLSSLDSNSLVEAFDFIFDKETNHIDKVVLYFSDKYADSYEEDDNEDDSPIGKYSGKSKLVITYSNYKTFNNDDGLDFISNYLNITKVGIVPSQKYMKYTFISHIGKY